MKIAEILRAKTDVVDSIGPRVTLSEANSRMAELNIGAMIVHDIRDGYLGVLSERDILRKIAADGPSALEATASELMTRSPPSCTPDADVHKVMEMMTHRRIRHVPVVVDGDVTGIVSIGDIVKHLLDEARLEIGVLRDFARAH